VVAAAMLPGIGVGLVYTWLVLKLLGTLWKGATQTGGFNLFPGVVPLLAGTVVSAGIALLLLRIVIVRSLKPVRQRKIKGNSFWWKIPFSRRKLVWAGLYANRKRVLLSFFTLTVGVGIVFSVGLNRRGFTDSRQLLSGTGGYSLWCESSVPVYHNIATPQGRDKLVLNGLPEGTQVLQMLRYAADDASCLNLNKVSQPTVLGVDMDILKDSEFKILRSIYPDGVSVFDTVQTAVDSVYPVLIDETVLTWGLMLKPGDTIHYESGTGRKVSLRLAGVLANSVFQGNILLDKKLFSGIWSEITGSEILLFKVNDPETVQTKQLVSQSLSEYGVKVETTARRLETLNSVTDTYLTIFLTLGGIGLLLGMMSFIIVVRKDLIARREQIRLYRSLGYTDAAISHMLTAENRIVPLSATGFGVLASLIGVSGGFTNVSRWIWLMTIALALFLIAAVLIFIRQSVRSVLQRE
jgi:putative ABC transport system permease protein